MMSNADDGSSDRSTDDVVRRLIGVYDADGTVWGELSYWLGARLGRRHCALCDVTHGSVRIKREWVASCEKLAAPFVTYHRNDQPGEVRIATGDSAPAVLAATDGGVRLLLDEAAIERCNGSVADLQMIIDEALSHQGLRWP